MEVTEVVGVGQLIALGSANLIVTVLALRHARRSVDLAEHRVEALRAEQARLVALLNEERRVWRRELGEDRVRHLTLSEVRRREIRANQEATTPLDRERLAEELRRVQRERERERHARLVTEGRIERLEKELQELRDVSRTVNAPLVLAGTHGTSAATREAPVSSGPRATMTPRGLFDTTSKPAQASSRGKEGSGRAKWHLHPDDMPDERPPASRAVGRARGDAPVEMFRKHYDKYLENYEGYVELAESLHRSQTAAASSPFGERELRDRLRRLEDGIERTTARLDMLEQYNPELATDDRILRRANVARRHSELF